MAELVDLAIKEAGRIRNEMEELENDILSAPGGHLKCCKRGPFRYYYIIKTQDGKRRSEYIPLNQMRIAKELAMRDFRILKRSILARDLERLAQVMDGCFGFSDIMAAKAMNPDHFELIKETLFPVEDELKAWQEASYDRNGRYPEMLVQPTLSGIMVRSKSESMIADQLFRRGIPFRYEAQLFIEGREFYPDLTIMHPKDRRTLIWEHFGLMSSESYRASTFRKLALYSEAGYEIGKDLITTFEWEDAPLDPSLVSALIDHYFG